LTTLTTLAILGADSPPSLTTLATLTALGGYYLGLGTPFSSSTNDSSTTTNDRLNQRVAAQSCPYRRGRVNERHTRLRLVRVDGGAAGSATCVHCFTVASADKFNCCLCGDKRAPFCCFRRASYICTAWKSEVGRFVRAEAPFTHSFEEMGLCNAGRSQKSWKEK
jgi:hypothetical protein